MSDTDTPDKPDDIDAQDSWRQPLLASLKDCGVQRAPRLPALRYILAVLAYGFTFTVAALLGRLVQEISRTASREATMGLYVLLFLFVVFVLARIRNRFLRSAWQSSARSAEDEISQLGSRRPIFYLRSFGLDKRIGRRSWPEFFLGTRPMATAEQRLTAILKKIGPVVAIGRPDEKLPALGAARFYAADEVWQDKVVDVVKVSQMVAWATGVTEGLKWEISYLTENLLPRRLLLWCHPHLLGVSVAKREAEWKQFRDTLGGIFPKPLPETLGDTRFIVFDADWEPIPVAPRIDEPFTARPDSALKNALALRQNVLGSEPVQRPVDSSRSTIDFGSLLGARGPQLDWLLIAVFFLALAGSQLLDSMVWGLFNRLRGEYMDGMGASWIAVLIPSAVLAAAAIAAFRFIRGNWLPALATATMVTVVDLLHTTIAYGFAESTFSTFFFGDLLSPFLRAFCFVAALAWMVQKVQRLFTAFWLAGLFGFFAEEICRSLFSYYEYEREISFVSPVVIATLFALAYAFLLKAVPAVDKQLAATTPGR